MQCSVGRSYQSEAAGVDMQTCTCEREWSVMNGKEIQGQESTGENSLSANGIKDGSDR